MKYIEDNQIFFLISKQAFEALIKLEINFKKICKKSNTLIF